MVSNDTTASTAASGSGKGFVVADGGNVGGIAGYNAGTIQFSFNNARVNVGSVTISGGLSTNPVNKPVALSLPANIGGIAGYNADGGVINKTYATNFVGSYGIARSGGITGHNNGSVTDSRFISNGLTEVGAGDPAERTYDVTGQDLMNVDFTSGAFGGAFANVTFTSYTSMRTRFNTTGQNIYADYPFPILSNNSPFLSGTRTWGFEVIYEVLS